jgi:NADH:ubiquinone reductase (H+-translocating)
MAARIVVLGGGFGGVQTARHLEKLAGSDPGLEITLVSHDNFFLFTPMLHEVAASDLDITHIVSPIRTLLKRTTVFIGDVQSIDLEARRVTVSHGFDRHTHDLSYDHVVVGLGSITNFYGLPGLEQRALTMKTLGDAIHLRNRVIAALEEADTECQRDRDGLLTFVVAGGGFAGVETLAGLNDFIHEGLRLYPRIRPERVRTVLVHSGPLILPELGDKLGRYAERKLRARGVEILTNARVASVTADGVTLAESGPRERRRIRSCTSCRARSIAGAWSSTRRWRCPAGRVCGPSATVR